MGSLRVRLAVGAVLWSAGICALGGGTWVVLFRRHLETRTAAMLSAHLADLATAVLGGPEGPVVLRSLTDPRFAQTGSGLYWMVESHGVELLSPSLAGHRLAVGSSGATVSTIDATTGPAGALDSMERSAGPGGEPLLVVRSESRLGDGSPVRLTVAGGLHELDPEMRIAGPATVAALFGLGLALLVAGAIVVRLGLRPLDQLRSDLSAVRAGDAGALTGPYPSEVQPVVDDLNALIRHSETAVARAVAQAGNLAHALRTPLAVIANEADRLGGTGGEASGIIRQQAALLEQRIEHHLARARAAASGPGLAARAAVAPILDRLVHAVHHLHDRPDRSIDTRCDASLAFRGEARDLEEMLGNLLDNACKWGRTRVRVSAWRDDRDLWLAVEDDGPGLAPDLREEVFRRGTRLDESVPGSGLGLAIVRELAGLYGGIVSAGPSELGGLRVSLRLPAS